MWPEALAQFTAHCRWSMRRLCYSFIKGQFHHLISPLQTTLKWLASCCSQHEDMQGKAWPHPTPLALHLLAPASLDPFSHQESTLLLGVCPSCVPSLVHPPFPWSRLIFQPALLCPILQKAFSDLTRSNPLLQCLLK